MRSLEGRLGWSQIVRALPFVFLAAVCLWGIGSLQRSETNLQPGEYLPTTFNYLTRDSLVLADERFHFDQIYKFLHGDMGLNSEVTTFPTYHLVVAGVMKILGTDDISAARLVNLFFSFLSIFVVHAIARAVERKSAYIRTLQYSFFALTMPFFPLVYTDIFSLLVVLASFYFLTKRRYSVSGLFGIASILVRQDNAVWLTLFLLLAYYQENQSRINFHLIVKHLESCWLYYFAGAAFLIFVVLNGGISLVQKDLHPLSFTYTGNLYFSLFSFFFLFLPLSIVGLPKVVDLLIRRWYLGPAGALAAWFIGITFTVSHPFNFINGFVRNEALIFITSDVGLRLVFGAIVVYSGLVLMSTRFIRKEFYLVYPVVVLSVLPEWLIEPRYYIVPMVFFILFRRSIGRTPEWMLWGWLAVCSLAIFMVMIKGVLFI